MSFSRQPRPLEQLGLIGSVPDSGVVDRMAPHQGIAVPHWVEIRNGCLVGRYGSVMPLARALAEIKGAEGDPSSPLMGEVARVRQVVAEQPEFQPRYTTLDEKVVAELIAADREDVRYVPVDGRILTDFLGLHARKPASIEVFARRAGTLHTYTERFVSRNRLKDTSLWAKHYRALPEAIRAEDKENGVDVFEPIAYWQDFSKFAFLTLRFARQLDEFAESHETPIMEADWQFFEHFLDERRPRHEAFEKLPKRLEAVRPGASKALPVTTGTVRGLRNTFCEVLNKLQDIGDVKLELRWETSPPALEFRVTGLVSVIASQLLMAASQRDNFVLCKECMAAFSPWQQPRTGNFDLYCEPCRMDNAPQRNATRRYRSTQKYRDTVQRGKSKANAAVAARNDDS